MCVTKIEAFEHAGQIFHTERQALGAALKDIGKKVMTDHHANPAEGMLQHRVAILRVLGRIDELEAEMPEVMPAKTYDDLAAAA